MKRIILGWLGCGLALQGMAQLPQYDTSVYTFLRSSTTDSVMMVQQRRFRQQRLSVNGTVSDEQAVPLSGATVVLGNGAYQAISGTDGRYSFDLPHEAVQPWNIFSVSVPGKKRAVQSLHWTHLPSVLDFRLTTPTVCGCPPDSTPTTCCDIHIRMTVDELFEKATSTLYKKGGLPQTRRRKIDSAQR